MIAVNVSVAICQYINFVNLEKGLLRKYKMCTKQDDTVLTTTVNVISAHVAYCYKVPTFLE